MDQITHTVRNSKLIDTILQCQNRPAGMSESNGWLRIKLMKNLITIGSANFERKPSVKGIILRCCLLDNLAFGTRINLFICKNFLDKTFTGCYTNG